MWNLIFLPYVIRPDTLLLKSSPRRTIYQGISWFRLLLFWDNTRSPLPVWGNISWFGGKFQMDQSESRTSSKKDKPAEECDDFFGFLKCAFRGIRMATFNQSLNLYWGRMKAWNRIPLNKKDFKFNFTPNSDSLNVI